MEYNFHALLNLLGPFKQPGTQRGKKNKILYLAERRVGQLTTRSARMKAL
jgi:hypothetical protein